MENLTLEIKNMALSFGNKAIFSIEHAAAYQNERIGIVGRNGQGKTTLLNLIAGSIEPDYGDVKQKVTFNYFKQIEEFREVSANDELDAEMMSRMGVPQNTDQSLSGGEETKLRLTRILSNYQMGLLMDEPTTHLDEKSIQFLIDELEYYYGTMIIVSHDRYFLDQLVSKIWEVDNGQLTEYTGNYSDYIEQKEQQKLEANREAEKIAKEKIRLEQAVEQKKKQAAKMNTVSAKNKKRNIKPDRLSSSKQKDTVQKAVQKSAKALESRIKQLGDVELEGDLKPISFPTSEELEMHNRFPIRGESVTLEAGDKRLLEKVDFQFPLGKRIAITGDNGSGKSTLLKYILNHGEGIILSPKVVFQTYQQMDYKFSQENSVLDYLLKQTEYPENTVRAILNNLGFTQTEISKTLAALSGGEATRIAMAVLFVKPSNVLVLDEPTNFIDIQTIEALEGFIQSYPGTVLFTSHDKYFTEKTANQIWKIENKKLVLKKGDLLY